MHRLEIRGSRSGGLYGGVALLAIGGLCFLAVLLGSPDRSRPDWLDLLILGGLATYAGLHLLGRHLAGRPRLVLTTEGFEELGPFARDPVFVPWRAVVRIEPGRHARIDVTLRGTDVLAELGPLRRGRVEPGDDGRPRLAVPAGGLEWKPATVLAAMEWTWRKRVPPSRDALLEFESLEER